MTTKSAKRDLTQGDVTRHIIRMAVPMMIGIGAVISCSLVDSFFIGQLGAQELAAIGYTFPTTTLLFNLMFGMAIAMGAVVSRTVGAGRIEDVRHIVTIGLPISMMFALVMSLVTYLAKDSLFHFMGADDAVMPFINAYIPYILIGLVFVSVPVVGNAAIRGMGDAFWPAVIMVTVAFINLILDPLLIFGLGGFPQMGIRGAAIATMTANIAGAIMALFVAAYREKIIEISCLCHRHYWAQAAKALLVIAIPVSIANMINPLMVYGYTALLSPLGHEAVAGMGVVARLEAFVLIPIMALAGGMAAVIGQNFGAERYERVREILEKAMRFCTGYSVICAVLLAIFSSSLAYAFTDEKTVSRFIQTGLLIVPISYMGLSIFLIIMSSLNAMGQAKTSLILNTIRAFLLSLPLAWIGIELHGQDGFFVSVAIGNIIACAIAVYAIRRMNCV